MPPKTSEKAAAKAAAALAARQAAAENAFSDADTSGDGAVDAKEFEALLARLLRLDGVKIDEDVLQVGRFPGGSADSPNSMFSGPPPLAPRWGPLTCRK